MSIRHRKVIQGAKVKNVVAPKSYAYGVNNTSTQ